MWKMMRRLSMFLFQKCRHSWLLSTLFLVAKVRTRLYPNAKVLWRLGRILRRFFRSSVAICKLVFFAPRSKTTNWTSFDRYDEVWNSFWKVAVYGDYWDSVSCTCPVFMKHNIWKYSVGMAIPTKCHSVPKNRQVHFNYLPGKGHGIVQELRRRLWYDISYL